MNYKDTYIRVINELKSSATKEQFQTAVHYADLFIKSLDSFKNPNVRLLYIDNINFVKKNLAKRFE